MTIPVNKISVYQISFKEISQYKHTQGTNLLCQSCKTQSGCHVKCYGWYSCTCMSTNTMYLGGIVFIEVITIVLGNYVIVISHQQSSRTNQIKHLLAQFYEKVQRYKCSVKAGLFCLMKIPQTYINTGKFLS